MWLTGAARNPISHRVSGATREARTRHNPHSSEVSDTPVQQKTPRYTPTTTPTNFKRSMTSQAEDPVTILLQLEAIPAFCWPTSPPPSKPHPP
ncbi:unnamed protein product [Gadus morhua 'NCC']